MPQQIDYQDGEQWAMLPDFSRYLVSNHGRVYSVTQHKMLKLFENRPSKDERYLFVRLTKDDKTTIKVFVHRLVATAFIGDPTDKDIHHCDHNPFNNFANNLMILTRQEHLALHKKEREGQDNEK